CTTAETRHRLHELGGWSFGHVNRGNVFVLTAIIRAAHRSGAHDPQTRVRSLYMLAYRRLTIRHDLCRPASTSASAIAVAYRRPALMRAGPPRLADGLWRVRP